MNIENFHKKKRNLSTAWIDYRKAFDSLPHSWMLKAVDIYKVSLVSIDFLKNSVKLWNTNLFLNYAKGFMKSDKINISPLLFFLSLILLINVLNNSELDQDRIHKYLGIDKGNRIQHSKMKEKMRAILKT